MKKWIAISAAMLLLTGCGAEETFETVSDELIQQVSAEVRQMVVTLPLEAASPAVESDSGQMYICGDYDIYQQTLEAGDLNATIQTISGYGKEDLTVMETMQDDCKRYDFVWVSAGEIGDRVGRATILDDGNYHYCLSVLGDADTSDQYRGIWQSMFDSFGLSYTSS